MSGDGGAAKSASNSRLESRSGLCFVGVTSISNRSDSRLESISRRAESSARTRGAVVCFVGVTRGRGRIDFRLEIEAGWRFEVTVSGVAVIGSAFGAVSLGDSSFPFGGLAPDFLAALGAGRGQNRAEYLVSQR